MTEGCLRPIGTLCFLLLGKEGRGLEARPAVLGTFWDEWSQWRNRLPQDREVVARVGINQRVSLRKFADDIRRWVDQDRSDDWIASALGTSPSSVQTFRSRNAIYRRSATSTLYEPKEFASYEGVLAPEGPGVWFDPDIGSDPRWQKRWEGTERVELRLSPTKIVFLRSGGGAGGKANR
jgi:hypothetical protein